MWKNRYCRNRAKREFNKYWAYKTHPPSPDGTRRCRDCANDSFCTRPRKGNHMSCFKRKEAARPAAVQKNTGHKSGDINENHLLIILLALWGLIIIVFSAL